MRNVNRGYVRPGFETQANTYFPYAPSGWSQAGAEETAQLEDLSLSADHWLVVAALQEFYARHDDGVIDQRTGIA